MPHKIDPEEDVELGEEVEVRRRTSPGSLVAVRVNRELLARINEYGRVRGKTVSQVLREGAEALLNGALIVNYVSMSPPPSAPIETSTITLISQPSVGGRTINMREEDRQAAAVA